MVSEVNIRPLSAADQQAWFGLWQGYTDFYNAVVPQEITAHTFARAIDPASPLLGHGAEIDGVLVGFSLSILHEGTFCKTPICYLEDLFVDPAARGQGAARALIRNLVETGKAEGWAKLYWHTQIGNPARKLYDDFVEADDFVRYVMKL